MSTKTGVIIGAVALAFIVGGAYVFTSTGDTAGIPRTTDESVVMEKDGEIMNSDEKGEKGEMMNAKDVDMTAKEVVDGEAAMKGSYEAYSPEKIARAETGDVVLFFHASWCPSCRVLNSALEASSSDIPGGVTILKVDYDKEVELKKKYGVTSQHTLVQVTAQGELIKKWSGGSRKLENVLGQIM